MSSNVSVAPPDLSKVDKRALAIANFLRHNPELKQRQGIINAKRQDFFRVKRAVRALESEEYKKKQQKNPQLPPINSRNEALEAFRLLPLNQLAFRVAKWETEEAKLKGLKPVQGVPCIRVIQQQEFGDDMYYSWFYEPVRPITYVYGALALVAIFGIVLFPLWPVKIRVGVWYLSMGLVGLLAAFFGIALVRLIVFCITYVVLKPGFWLFPNLFEDVGFVDSFIPLYGWHGKSYLPNANKPKKKGKKRNLGLSPHEMNGNGAGAEGPQKQQQQQQAQAQALLNQKLGEVMAAVEKRKKEIMADPEKAPKNQQEAQALQQRLFGEEMKKMQEQMQEMRRKVMEMSAQKANSSAQPVQEAETTTTSGSDAATSESKPVKRVVTLEDDTEE
ncbi:hypothetical protein TRVA0_022S01310 [Trichomonascus vanleenenianus]|uniref:Sec63 complex subunit SEC62 n=1 Tax=Trichomonascus vanleenenianus TaxID=2268995 RepID=UPI003ECAC920